MSAESCSPLPEGLRIEAARKEDSALLCQLIRELAEFEELTAECVITPEALEKHVLGDKRSAEAMIAWVGEEAAGFAVYYTTFSTFVGKPGVYLEDLFVRKTLRHKGIGKALLREVGRIAHEAGAGRYEWTTLEWNKNARSLYASIGAKEMRDWLLLRMEAEDLAEFACAGRKQKAGEQGHKCQCGGRGKHHAQQQS